MPEYTVSYRVEAHLMDSEQDVYQSLPSDATAKNVTPYTGKVTDRYEVPMGHTVMVRLGDDVPGNYILARVSGWNTDGWMQANAKDIPFPTGELVMLAQRIPPQNLEPNANISADDAEVWLRDQIKHMTLDQLAALYSHVRRIGVPFVVYDLATNKQSGTYLQGVCLIRSEDGRRDQQVSDAGTDVSGPQVGGA